MKVAIVKFGDVPVTVINGVLFKVPEIEGILGLDLQVMLGLFGSDRLHNTYEMGLVIDIDTLRVVLRSIRTKEGKALQYWLG